MSETRPNASRGFTLVEIMMAMMLLGATGVSLLGAFSSSTSVTDAPENSAYYLASQQLAGLNEAVRQDWWSANGRPLSLAGAGPAPAVENLGTHTYTPVYVVNPNAGGNPTGTAIDLNGDGDEDYRKVKVTVTWP